MRQRALEAFASALKIKGVGEAKASATDKSKPAPLKKEVAGKAAF